MSRLKVGDVVTTVHQKEWFRVFQFLEHDYVALVSLKKNIATTVKKHNIICPRVRIDKILRSVKD